MTNDYEKFFPHAKNPRKAGNTCFSGVFSKDGEFDPEYGESLSEGDLRPYVIKDYVEENE